MLGSIREGRLFFFFFFGGGYLSFLAGYFFLFAFLISVLSIGLMGHGDSVWGFGDILTATAH